MIFQYLIPHLIEYSGIPPFDQHKSLSVQIGPEETFFLCQRMLPGDRDTTGQLIKQKDAVLFSPLDGIAGADKTVDLLSQGGKDGIQTGGIIIEWDDVKLKGQAPVIEPRP